MPDFIELIDIDPKQAAKLFTSWAEERLLKSPPTKIYSVKADDRQDVIQEIIFHCIDDGLKVLRQYEDQDRTFAAWFYWVARNKIIDYLKSKASGVQTINSGTSSDLREKSDAVTPGIPKEELKNLLRIIEDCFEILDQKCRILLRLAAHEWRPKEIVRLLRMQEQNANKKISSQITYCRTKLRECAESRGASLEGL